MYKKICIFCISSRCFESRKCNKFSLNKPKKYTQEVCNAITKCSKKL